MDLRQVILSGKLLQACAEGSTAEVRRLLADGASPNVQIKGGGLPSALHFAVLSSSREVVELLLEHGADLNAHDPQGHTPLQLAERAGHTDIVELLEDHGPTD